MLLKITYLIMRWTFGLAVLVFRGDQAKSAELLVLRHENAVLRRNAGGVRYRGSNFTRSFDDVFQATGATILRTAVRAPRMNVICERLVGTLRREILDRSPILGEAHLRGVLAEYQEHYSTARPHQGIGQRIPDSEHHLPRVTAGDFRIRQIRRKPVLSGLINEYERAA